MCASKCISNQSCKWNSICFVVMFFNQYHETLQLVDTFLLNRKFVANTFIEFYVIGPDQNKKQIHNYIN